MRITRVTRFRAEDEPAVLVAWGVKSEPAPGEIQQDVALRTADGDARPSWLVDWVDAGGVVMDRSVTRTAYVQYVKPLRKVS